jgi:hypothetical protein
MIDPKVLVDKGICDSFSEARRMIICCPDKIEKEIQQADQNNFGRRPIKCNIVYPKRPAQE